MSKRAQKSREKEPQARVPVRTAERHGAQTPNNPLLTLQRAAGNRAVTGLLNGSSGKPLDRATKNKMESRFEQSFDDVRIHSGPAAEGAAEILGADAWTSGRDVVFAAGQYSPETESGEKLLAHELAHVVQQRRGGSTPQAFETNSSLEHDAASAAAQLASGSGPVAVNAASAPGVARQESDQAWWKKRLNPIYQRALEVLPKDAAAKLEQANETARSVVKVAGISDASLDRAVQAADPALGQISAALGVKDSPSSASPDATPAPASPQKSTAPISPVGAGGALAAITPFMGPGGGTTPTLPPPSVPDGVSDLRIPTGASPDAYRWDIAARRAAPRIASQVGKEVGKEVGEDLVKEGVGFLPRLGVAGAAFAVGAIAPFAIGYSIEHGAELQQQPDPDERDQAIAGAPPPITDDLDAGAPEAQQAPSATNSAPALDPTPQNDATLPPQQDPAPAVDPSPKGAAQLPGPSSDPAEFAGSSRPGLRDSTILQVWQNALKRGNGVVKDPITGEKLDPPYYDENGKLVYDWHMGHLEDHEWWRLRKMYEAGKLSWKEVIEQYNDPSHYHPEDPSENVSHEHESKTQWVLPDGTVIRFGLDRPRRRAPVPNKPARRRR